MILLLLIFLPFATSRDLKFVQAIWRHGDRAPTGLPYPNDPFRESSWPRGWGQLTSLGMEEEFELGEFFRKKYDGFINSSYIPSQAYMLSSSTDRALTSAQSFLAGMYPATGSSQWSNGNSWQPIPVHSTSASEDDYLCRCTSVDCPNYDKIYNADEARDANTYTTEYADFFALLAQTNTTGNPNFTYSDVNGIYDITRELTHNLTNQPLWVNQVFPQYGGRTTLDIGSELRGIRYMNQFGTQQKGQFYAGYLLNNFISNAQTVAAGKQNNPDRMLWYSSHDTVISSLMYAMNLGNNEMPPYSACFFMEVYNNNGIFETEFFYKNGTEPFRLTIPGCDLPCPVAKLAQIYKNIAFPTIAAAQKNCGVIVEQCSNKPSSRLFSLFALIIPILFLLF